MDFRIMGSLDLDCLIWGRAHDLSITSNKSKGWNVKLSPGTVCRPNKRLGG